MLILEQRASDGSVGGRFTDCTQQKSIFEWFPTEIIYEILSWASAPDPDPAGSSLYTMTRVSNTMSTLALPQFITINKRHLPKSAPSHILLSRRSFGLFPAWTRSEKFAPRKELICYFSGSNIERDVDAVGVGLCHIHPQDRPRTVTIEGNLNVTQFLSLLDILGQMHTEIVEVDILNLDWSSQKVEADGIILPQTLKLQVDWITLKPHNWHVLLGAISAPRLQTLLLEGDVPWNVLVPFLARHPTIKEICLPTCPIPRVPRRFSALQMPQLQSLKGKMSQVISLSKLITHSTSLSIDASLPSNASLTQTVHGIMASLPINGSGLSITTNLTSTKSDGPLTKPRRFTAPTVKKLREYSDRLAHLTGLCLRVVGMEDQVLIVSPTLLL